MTTQQQPVLNSMYTYDPLNDWQTSLLGGGVQDLCMSLLCPTFMIQEGITRLTLSYNQEQRMAKHEGVCSLGYVSACLWCIWPVCHVCVDPSLPSGNCLDTCFLAAFLCPIPSAWHLRRRVIMLRGINNESQCWTSLVSLVCCPCALSQTVRELRKTMQET